MEQLNLDTGLRVYKITGGGELRFNPADPNLYGRFATGAEQLQDLERTLAERGANLSGEEMLALLQEADEKIKGILGEIFGGDNDFHKALGGISLLAVAGNGKTVAQNLFAALETVLEAGAQKLVDARVDDLRAGL